MQIGVSDYFYAEVQKGLSPGEVVSLELPPKDKIQTPAVEKTLTSPGANSRPQTSLGSRRTAA